MSREVVEPVKAEPKGADAFTAARAAVGKEPAESAIDDTPTKAQPSQEPEKVADETPEPTENDDTLTAEELAALPPKERAKAEKWQAKLTQKAQALSARDKEFDEWKPLIEGLKTNPKEALAQVAKQLGMTVAEAKAIQDTPVEDLPEELQFLKPVFEKREKALEAKMRAELAPIREAHERIIMDATASETEATMKQFSTDFPGWEKHEAKMMDIGKTILPGKGMTDYDYLKTLHSLATAEIAEAEKTKKVVAKINNAARVSEEKTSGIPAERVTQSVPAGFAQMDNKERMRASHEAAKQGVVWEK